MGEPETAWVFYHHEESAQQFCFVCVYQQSEAVLAALNSWLLLQGMVDGDWGFSAFKVGRYFEDVDFFYNMDRGVFCFPRPLLMLISFADL